MHPTDIDDAARRSSMSTTTGTPRIPPPTLYQHNHHPSDIDDRASRSSHASHASHGTAHSTRADHFNPVAVHGITSHADGEDVGPGMVVAFDDLKLLHHSSHPHQHHAAHDVRPHSPSSPPESTEPPSDQTSKHSTPQRTNSNERILDRTTTYTLQSSGHTSADVEKSGNGSGSGNGGGVGNNGSGDAHDSPFAASPARRTVLLCVFSLSIALDVVNVSALLTTTETIASDLGLVAGNVTWIITAYSMTFASFMLFAGRLADLFPAQWLFEGGLFLLGVLMLVLSFIRNKYAFLVIRALQGICGAMTVPSAYHLIVHLYTDRHQQQMALAALGLAGAISNSIGVILGGLFELGNSDWPWLFRFLAIVALSACAVGWLMMPKAFTPKNKSKYSKFQQMDLLGVFLLTGSLLLFILGLTSGTTDGWTDAHFLAPFLISVAMFAAFFLWERRLPDERALLPMGVWRLPNLPLLAFAAISPYMFWGTTQLGFANYWQVVHGVTPILASARLLPEGIAGLVGGVVVQVIPKLLSRPKYTMIGGQFLAGVGLILLIFSQGGNGNDYWRFVFTGFVIGSFGAILTFLALNVSIVQAVPPQASGVAGALLQVCLQIGAVIGLSVQAGLYSRVNNDLSDWKGSQYGFWFIFAWMMLTGLIILVAYRPEKSVQVLEQLQEEQQQQDVKVTEKAPQGDVTSQMA